MFRFCNSLYDLPFEIQYLLANYKYNHEALLSYLAAVIEGSVPVNLISDLLGKKGRYSTEILESSYEEHPHFDLLTDYMLKRIQNPLDI